MRNQLLSVNFMNPSWKILHPLSRTEIYSDPRQPTDPNLMTLIGWSADREGYLVFQIPKETPISEVITFFGVGGKTEYDGANPEETRKLLCWLSKSIEEIAPHRPVFADFSGLSLRFERSLEMDDLDKILALFEKEKDHDLGLEYYASQWVPGAHLLAPLLNDNVLHLWWD